MVDDEGGDFELGKLMAPVLANWRILLGGMVLAGVLAACYSTFVMTPQFTSTTTFLPPQQQQSSAAAALSSLGPLAGLAGANLKSPADQYISLMQSVTVADRMIDRFNLMSVYKSKYRRDARKVLGQQTQMALGKKDSLISVSVDDPDPKRAAAMANQYVDELRRMTSVLAVSEAQQRRVFFEGQMQAAKGKLIAAQTALQDSGFTSGAIKAAPQAAAEQYAQLRAQATAAEVRLQTLRSSLTDATPEVTQQISRLESLRSKLAQYETTAQADPSAPDYISKYREFKYQETLFDLLSKQYELARVDESHEGGLIQVVDPALPAELKSKPQRAIITIEVMLVAGMLISAGLVLRERRRRSLSPA